MKRAARPARRAFTLAEVMIALAGSTVVLGALLFSSMQLQRALHASERHASSQADQRRLLDYLSRDLRRAVGIASTSTVNGAGGARVAGAAVVVENGVALALTLPGYYQSEAPDDARYDEALPVVTANNYVDYGRETGHASGVRVLFRKQLVQSEGAVCFVRIEADAQTVIVREAENLHLQVAVAADGRSCVVDVAFIPPANRAAPRITSRDQILLRNIRAD